MADNDPKEVELKVEAEPDIEVEIEDDTPEQDRGRDPLPKELVEELETDDLEDYSEKVKVRLKQMKKVWHDERREKERAFREQQEAITLAQRVLSENQQLKSRLSEGEKYVTHTAASAVAMEVEAARKDYKDAYEAGDPDKLIEAQEKLTSANFRLQNLNQRKIALQQQQDVVNSQKAQAQTPAPQIDQKTLAWRDRNKWFGQDDEMTASVLGLHQKLEKQHGAGFVGSDDYWNRVDETMRRRFPENFGDSEQTSGGTRQRTEKSATVVAPVTRSTSPKKIRLTQTQLALAKKFGLTPEQYAREYAKTMGN
jgi:hypothetical protein